MLANHLCCYRQTPLRTFVLQTDAFTRRIFHTQQFLHTRAVTQRGFCTEKFLHTDTLTHNFFKHQNGFCAEKRLHTDAFTHRCLWFHEVSMYTGVYTQMLLHREVFAQRPFYAQTCLHKETVIQSCFCTEVLHRTVFTQPLLRTETVA